jgi:predicted ATPase/class 3 adenylate cyclase
MPKALAEKINAASVKIAGERREVTVLFLDVTNFTAAAHLMDSEDVYVLIDEAMSLLIEVIYKYEGTIDKFTGDGLMALFGAPVAHENDPERAIRAALEMQSIVGTWRTGIKQRYGLDFQTRIGINTGSVIAGNLGSDLHMEYTVIGDTVNLASRLETAAKPDTILVSAETYQCTEPLFEFEALPPLMVKGMPDPILTYQPLSLREKPEGGRGLPGLQAPLVGRVSDLARLQEALTHVRQDGHSQIVLLTGQAGLGKSRLVAEFRRSLDSAETRVYQGNCLTYARSTSFHLVAELLRNLFHLSESDPEELQQQVVQTYLDQLNLAQTDILPYLLHVLGLPQLQPQLEDRLRLLEPAMLQRQTHAALRQLFLAEARLGPTVLIFEDLHWLDPASREFLQYLIQTTEEAPLLLIMVSREAERNTILQPLLAAARQEPERLVDLPLAALSASEGQALADYLISQTSAEAQTVKQHIVARAEGNPFYVEEIIRMLIDQGGLQRTTANDSWKITPQANDLLQTVPGTVRGLILARFDRLPETVRWLLQKAAVLGSSFPTSLLHQLADTGPDTTTVQLSQLEARQFLTGAPFRAQPGYTFQHALLQETLYHTLLKRDRRQIHLQVAQIIEASSLWQPEEQAELLVYHYAESNSPAQALPHLITAAGNAARRCAYETAVRHYRQAMTLLPAQPDDLSPDFFQVRLGLGRSLKYVGEFSAASQVLSEAIEHLRGFDLPTRSTSWQPLLVEGLRQLADVQQRQGSYDEALIHLETGLQVLGEAASEEEPRLWRALLDRMAWIRFRQGQLTEAFDLANQATANLDPADTDDPIRLASLHNTLGGVSWQQGQLAEAVAYVERSLALYERVGYSWGQGIAYANLGILAYTQGRWAEAADYYEQAYAWHENIGDLQHQAINLENLGILHTVMGNHETARQELESSLSIRQRLGDTWGTAQSHVNLAYLALVQARFDAAETHAQTTLILSQTIGSSAEIEVPARWCLALVQAEHGQLEAGLQSARQAVEMARSAGFLEGETDSLRVLGSLNARAGHYTQAETFLRNSIKLSSQQKMRYRHGLALLELGSVYLSRFRIDEANRDQWQAQALDTLNEAVRQFESLGAAHDLHLAQTVLTQLQSDGLNQA